MPLTSQFFIRPFEFFYPKLELSDQKIEYIVVLGCWHNDDDKLPLVAQLDQCSLTRIVQAVQFWYQRPDSRLVVSGWQGKIGKRSHPEVYAQMAISLGVPSNKIIRSVGSKDTAEEARAIKYIVTDKPLVLVTSASHMRRAVHLFQQNQMNPFPAPAEFLGGSGQGDFSWTLLIPSARGLQQTERAIYEAFGNAWVEIKAIFKGN
jgi:uncharacterized SAM-binding protein YcdF (DUF218 family)